MVTVIDLSEVFAARNAPDPSCVSTDSDGNRVYLYSVHYRHNDRTYALDIWARSLEDAEAHVASLRQTARLDGQVVARG